MRKHLDLAAIRRGWDSYYDRMLNRMQAPEARESAKRMFSATPEELGKAAVEQAKKYCDGCRYGSHCLGADSACACGCR